MYTQLLQCSVDHGMLSEYIATPEHCKLFAHRLQALQNEHKTRHSFSPWHKVRLREYHCIDTERQTSCLDRERSVLLQ